MRAPHTRPSIAPALALALAALAAAGACGGSGREPGAISGGPGPVVRLDAGARGGGGGGDGGAGAGGAGGCAAGAPAWLSACHACEAERCTSPAWTGVPVDGGDFDPSAPGQGEDWYARCHSPTDIDGKPTPAAREGPAAGAPKARLCEEVLDCVLTSRCDLSAGYFPCYCRGGPYATADEREKAAQDCLAGRLPPGPCKTQIENAAETSEPPIIGARRFDPAYALGAALGLALYCDSPATLESPVGRVDRVCAETCWSGGAADGGASCGRAPADAGGSDGDGGASTGTGGGSPDAGAGGSGGGGTGGAGGGGTGAGGGPPDSCGNGADDWRPLDEALLGRHATDEIRGLFTAATDPNDLNGDGFPDPIGFGPGTLPSQAQRDAAAALIRRLTALLPGSVRNATNTAAFAPPGSSTNQANAPNGLLTLGALPDSLISGSSLAPVAGTAFDAYRAAAIADASGPRASDKPPGLTAAAAASNATVAAYVSRWAIDPASALGLADNVVHYALQDGLANLLAPVCAGGGTDAGGGGASGDGGAGGAGPADPARDGGAPDAGGADAASEDAGSGGTGAGGSGGAGGAGGARGCPDLDGDGVADCQQTLARNAGFDRDVAGWAADPGASASWTALDARGVASSGALAVANTDADAAHATAGGWIASGAAQCLPVAEGARYRVAVQALLRAPPGGGGGWAGFVVDYYASPDCAPPAATFPFLSQQVAATGTWLVIAGATTQIPVGVRAVALRLVAAKPPQQPLQEAVFDNLLIRRCERPDCN